MSLFTKDSDWIKWHGARALILAAWYDCHDVCEHLVDHGISQNGTSSFPPTVILYDLGRPPYPFTGSGTRITAKHCRQTNPYSHWQSGYISSPLIEAAVEGNIRTVKVLLDRGADVNLRCEGFTAAGLLVFALEANNLNKERRLGALKLIIEKGVDVNEPIYENPAFGGQGFGSSGDLSHSDETLLDKACLTHDNELTGLLQKYDKSPESLLTISGIITNAKGGFKELQDYLRVANLPRGSPRRRIQEISLYRCFGRPEIFSVIVQADFDLRLLHVPYTIFDADLQWHQGVAGVLEHLFSKVLITSLSKGALTCMAKKGVEIRAGLIKACLDIELRDDLQDLLINCLHLREIEGTVMMVEAVQQRKVAAIPLLKSIGIDINGTLKFKDCDCSVLLLAAMKSKIDNEPGLLQKWWPASTEMLEFLVSQGADIRSCYPTLESFFNREFFDLIDMSCLAWFVCKGFDLPGDSICDILIRRLKGCRSLPLLQALLRRNVPVFSADERLEDHRKFTTNIHPLSFFILLKPGLDFIYRVLGSGIDVNGTGRDVLTETPLLAAANTGDQGLVLELIARGASTNEFECKKLLQLACGYQNHRHCCPPHFELARYALENGSDPNSFAEEEGGTENNCGHIPLEMALLSPHADAQLIELLVNRGADVNALIRVDCLVSDYDREGSILSLALVEAHGLGADKQRVVEMFIERGARINARWMRGRSASESALEVVCEYGGPDRVDLIRLLLNRGAKPSQLALEAACGYYLRFGEYDEDNDFDEPGHNCDGPGCVDSVKLLLDRGFELNPPMEFVGSVCLGIVCKAGNLDLAKLLLDRGMDPNPKNSRSGGPLMVAAKRGDLAMAILLLAAGAKVLKRYEPPSKNPLVAAAKYGRLDMVALLVGVVGFEARQETFESAISAAREGGFLSIASYVQRYADGSSSARPQA
ncbi:MAG: hypothetical protein M1822_007217 [Bathelium mastoideum]|nr:MAG: hypothetical protein M1822_007217 [Bathelium mastoideum]